MKKNITAKLSAAAITLVMVFASTMAKAANSSHTQLLRNSELENASLKVLLPVNSPKKFKNGSAELTNEKVTKKAKELEGVFLSVMLEPMFPTGKESDLYGGGNAQGVFRTLMLQEYGNIMAEGGGVGLASGIEKQLKQQQQ